MDVPEEVPSPGGPYRVGVGIRMRPGHVVFTWWSLKGWEQKPKEATSTSTSTQVDRKAPTYVGNGYENEILV